MARRADRHFAAKSPEAADLDARDRNGAYKGPCEVRHLPLGVCGDDLVAERQPPAKGQVWARGPERVRITWVSPLFVTFLELARGGRLRRINRPQFLRTSRRIAE